MQARIRNQTLNMWSLFDKISISTTESILDVERKAKFRIFLFFFSCIGLSE
jgi:hypothetical protein